MARVFGELEMSYFQEVLDSGQLGWYHKENSMTTRFEEAFAEKVAPWITGRTIENWRRVHPGAPSA